MKIKISIITVVYNAVDTLEQTMLSVLNQNYDNIEYIIIDGSSTDGSVDIIKKYADRLAYWVSEPDKGIYDAMNKGIQNATGDWIGIINADDWYESDACHIIATHVLLHPEAEFFYGKMHFLKKSKSIIWGEQIKNIKVPRMLLAHPSCFVKRKVYESLGAFNCSYKLSADYEFVLRCNAEGIRFCFCNSILANMRDGGRSNSNFLLGISETKNIALKYDISKIQTYFSFFLAIFKSYIHLLLKI